MVEVLALIALTTGVGSGAPPIEQTQRAIVKVYGVGGVAGLEGYQTGVFVDEEGLVVTADSVVLERGVATLVDAFGDRYEARLVAQDPRSGLALLACPDQVVPPGVAAFAEATADRLWGRVFVYSNAFNIAAGDEPVSVQRGRVAAVAPIPLSFEGGLVRPQVGVPAAGERVVLIDAVTSNPGSPGGLVTDASGRPIGLLGAECRSPLTGAWINYALPAESVKAAIEGMRAGGDQPQSNETDSMVDWRKPLWRVGLALAPSIVDRTPAYIEAVEADSIAARAGFAADDLIVAIDGATVATAEAAGRAITRRWDAGRKPTITVLRGDQLESLMLPRIAP